MSKETKAQDKPEGNIKNLTSLKKEFSKGMLPRKAIMLKEELIKLHLSKKITDEEKSLLKTILRKNRSKGDHTEKTYDRDTQIINWIERNECEEECRCIQDSTIGAMFLTLDRVYKFRENSDEEMFYVYVEYEVPTEHQMSKETILKLDRGHPTTAKDFNPPRTDIRYTPLKAKSFHHIFRVEEDLLNQTSEENEQYTF